MTGRSPGSSPPPPPPHGLTLFDHARLAAALAEGDRSASEILAGAALTEAQWAEATAYWMGRIGDAVAREGELARVPLVYSDAFAEAQDAIRPAPEMDGAGWANLLADIQEAGAPERPLRARKLRVADFQRLGRAMAARLVRDPEENARFAEVFAQRTR